MHDNLSLTLFLQFHTNEVNKRELDYFMNNLHMNLIIDLLGKKDIDEILIYQCKYNFYLGTSMRES